MASTWFFFQAAKIALAATELVKRQPSSRSIKFASAFKSMCALLECLGILGLGKQDNAE